MPVCTFKPLRRNRYLHVQSLENGKHVILKKRQLEPFRSRVMNAGKRRPPPLPAREALPVVEVGYSASFVYCPACHYDASIRNAGPLTCPCCGMRFEVKFKARKASYW